MTVSGAVALIAVGLFYGVIFRIRHWWQVADKASRELARLRDEGSATTGQPQPDDDEIIKAEEAEHTFHLVLQGELEQAHWAIKQLQGAVKRAEVKAESRWQVAEDERDAARAEVERLTESDAMAWRETRRNIAENQRLSALIDAAWANADQMTLQRDAARARIDAAISIIGAEGCYCDRGQGDCTLHAIWAALTGVPKTELDHR